MVAQRENAATIRKLELEIDRLLEEQVESLSRPLLSITNEEAVRFAAGRDMLAALLKQLARLKTSTPPPPPDGGGELLRRA